MMMGLTLRLASMKDADCLFEWRNDPETRKASHSTEWVEVADHMQWLKASLSNSNRRLYIAEKNMYPLAQFERTLITVLGRYLGLFLLAIEIRE